MQLCPLPYDSITISLRRPQSTLAPLYMDVIHSCTNAFPNPFKSLRTCTLLSTTDDTKIEYLAPVTKQYEPPSNFGNHPNFHRPSKRNKSHHRRNLAQNVVPPQSFFHSLQTTLIRLRNNWVGKTETTRLLSSMQQTAVSGGPPRTKFFVPESAQPEKQFISVGVWAWKFRRPGPSSSARLAQPGWTWGRFGIDFPLWRESSYSGLPSWERVRDGQAKCLGGVVWD